MNRMEEKQKQGVSKQMKTEHTKTPTRLCFTTIRNHLFYAFYASIRRRRKPQNLCRYFIFIRVRVLFFWKRILCEMQYRFSKIIKGVVFGLGYTVRSKKQRREMGRLGRGLKEPKKKILRCC